MPRNAIDGPSIRPEVMDKGLFVPYYGTLHITPTASKTCNSGRCEAIAKFIIPIIGTLTKCPGMS